MTMLDQLERDGRSVDRDRALNPAMVIAATINVRGNIDVPLVEGGAIVRYAGVEFGICGDGEIVQQPYFLKEYVKAGGDGARGESDPSGRDGACGESDPSGCDAASGRRAASGTDVPSTYGGLPKGSLPSSQAAGHRLDPEPLDMILLANGLNELLERHTPSLFRLVRDLGHGGPMRLAYAGAASDRLRIKLLHDAFAIHLLAYEEHLV